MKDTNSIKLLVPKIHCEGCENTILAILGEHQEVQNPEVDLEEKSVRFSHPASLNPDLIKADLENTFGEVYIIEEP